VSDSVTISNRDQAVAFLNERIGSGVKPGLERITGLLDLMGDPQLSYSVIHVAGTNGKTTVTRLVADILGAHGYRTGTFTSPHLHRVEERFGIDGEVIAPEALVEAVSEIAWFVEEYERRAGTGVTYFEVTAALALSLFAAAAIDVAVVEVGLGGRWDATNVVVSDVAAITGIALDHMEYLGETVGEIAAEKAAIVDPDGTVVTGPLPAGAEGAVTARVAETNARWLRYGDDFSIEDETLAVGGWVADIEGIYAPYHDIYLPLHGRHQVVNLTTAIAISEAFVGHRLDAEALRTAVAATKQPGRVEVVHRHPLVIVDGSHNQEGVEGLAAALNEEFPDEAYQLVVGLRGTRSPGDVLVPLDGQIEHVFACAPDDPAAQSAESVAEEAAEVLGCEATVFDSVPEALEAAMAAAGPGGAVVVAGSLYVAGEAREALVGTSFEPSGVHVRYEAEIDLRDEL
jgi:dihydrofolate synthase / folylpolyglutamate synthase